MANIHDMREARANNGSNFNRPLLNPNTNDELELFTNPIGSNKDPRDESFWDMLSFAIKIRIKKWSIFKFLVLLFFISFILQLFIDGIERYNITDLKASSFMPINLIGPYSYTFANIGFFVKNNYQVYRTLTSLFLHADLTHILVNSITTLIIGGVVELFFPNWYIILIIIVTGVSGNIYALCWANLQTIAIGFSTAFCGIGGALLGFLIFNWRNMTTAHYTRLFLVLLIFFNFLFSVFSSSIRLITPKRNLVVGEAAHFGGFISGVFLGMLIAPVYKNLQINDPGLINYMLRVKIIGGLLLAGLFGGSLFYFQK